MGFFTTVCAVVMGIWVSDFLKKMGKSYAESQSNNQPPSRRGKWQMPWSVVKRDCKQSDGKSGSYAVVKKKSDSRTEQSSCHASKEKAQGSIAARKMREEDEVDEEDLREWVRLIILEGMCE